MHYVAKARTCDPRSLMNSLLLTRISKILLHICIRLSCRFMFDVLQPATGVLGTNRKSTVYKLIQPGLLFPQGYLWQVEKVRSDYLCN